MRKNVLITGMPRSGKSTLLKKLVAEIPHKVGFVTSEISGEHGRLGFEIETQSGKKAILAHVDFNTSHQVSRYFVDIDNLEAILAEVANFDTEDILYLDEIGQMQLFSKRFEELVSHYLDAPNTCIATLSYVFENGFTRRLRERDDIILVELAPEDRDEKEAFVRQLLRKIEKAKRYIADPERFARNDSGVELRSEHGVRNLRQEDGKWSCTCDFFSRYGICSHAIAADELFRD